MGHFEDWYCKTSAYSDSLGLQPPSLQIPFCPIVRALHEHNILSQCRFQESCLSACPQAFPDSGGGREQEDGKGVYKRKNTKPRVVSQLEAAVEHAAT